MLNRLKGCFLLLMVVSLSGCLGHAVTGMQLVYDRHNVFKKVNDFNIAAATNRALYKDHAFRTSHIDVTVFNRDVLLAGQTPTASLREEAYARAKKIPKVRRVYNELQVEPPISSAQTVNDSLITAHIRAQIVADDDIDPNQFKVVTENGVVYLLGDVKREQANLVVNIARHTGGVRKVIRAFRYYTYEQSNKKLA